MGVRVRVSVGVRADGTSVPVTSTVVMLGLDRSRVWLTTPRSSAAPG